MVKVKRAYWQYLQSSVMKGKRRGRMARENGEGEQRGRTARENGEGKWRGETSRMAARAQTRVYEKISAER